MRIKTDETKIYLSSTIIDLTRQRVYDYMSTHYGPETAARDIWHYDYFVNAAAAYPVRLLMNKRPSQIARRIHANAGKAAYEVKAALYALSGIDNA